MLYLAKNWVLNMIEKNIIAADGHEIQTYIWPHDAAKGWVHIVHGMAEHAARYDDFAKNLVAAGYAVVAHNHRGHGASHISSQNNGENNGKKPVLGVYKGSNGWQNYVQDIAAVRADICAHQQPYFIFGHSMGSFIAQSYLAQQPQNVAGLILSGSNHQAVWLSRVGGFVAKIESLRLGRDNSSSLLQFLSFGSFNQKFKPNRTAFDWLSRDAAQVDKYIADPLCGFACSTGLWSDFLAGLAELYKPNNLKNIAADMPIFILGGAHDPVGLMGTGLPKLLKAYKDSGHKNLSLKLFENGRHEMLNETNKSETYAEIIKWLDQQN